MVRYSLLAVLLVMVTAGAATAAPNGTATTTATPTPTETPVVNASGASVGQVGPVMTVLDFSYDSPTMTVLVRAQVPTTVTLSEQVDDPTGGAATFTIRRTAVPQGKSRVSIDARTVAITTPQSVQAGRGLIVSADDAGGPSPFRRFAPWTTLLLGAAVMVAWMVVGSVLWLRGEGNAPVRADA